MKKAVSIGLLTLFLASAAQAAQKPRIIPLAGWEADSNHQGFAFHGAIGDYALKNKWSLTGFLIGSYLYYRYPIPGADVKAESPGVHYLGGLKYNWSNETYASALIGGVSRDTEFKGGRIEQIRGETGVSGMAEGNVKLPEHLFFNALGTLNFEDDYVWSRFTLKRQVGNFNYAKPWVFHAGAVGTFQGNTVYEAQQGGALIEAYYIPFKVSISLQGGYKWDSSWQKGHYGSINFSKEL